MDYFAKRNLKPLIEEKPHNNLIISVVIPSYNEPELWASLQALAKCDMPKGAVEVLVVINHPEGSPPNIVATSDKCYHEVLEVDKQLGHSELRFYAIKAYDLPKKHAGVGMARQIGMDQAAYRFATLQRPQGIIACFDADALCATNYLVELHKLWATHPDTAACSIRYEHPTKGTKYNNATYCNIAAYELHLRYYNQAQRLIKYPFAYQTVGSSMACTAETYTRVGGMNRRQAGEDFYFLQKIIPHGKFRQLNSTCIYPSPRASTRVPFGTGRAMSKLLEHENVTVKTYNLQAFTDLTPFFASIENFYNADKQLIYKTLEQLPPAICTYLNKNHAADEIYNARQNTGSFPAFRKRFFLWFDAFKLLKYMNFAHETIYKREPINEQANKLLTMKGLETNPDIFELLKTYRILDTEEITIKI